MDDKSIKWNDKGFVRGYFGSGACGVCDSDGMDSIFDIIVCIGAKKG